MNQVVLVLILKELKDTKMEEKKKLKKYIYIFQNLCMVFETPSERIGLINDSGVTW